MHGRRQGPWRRSGLGCRCGRGWRLEGLEAEAWADVREQAESRAAWAENIAGDLKLLGAIALAGSLAALPQALSEIEVRMLQGELMPCQPDHWEGSRNRIFGPVAPPPPPASLPPPSTPPVSKQLPLKRPDSPLAAEGQAGSAAGARRRPGAAAADADTL